jgi:hypothetical protein
LRPTGFSPGRPGEFRSAHSPFKKYPSSQRMFALANECLGIMNQFGKFNVVWKVRANNVERFGH